MSTDTVCAACHVPKPSCCYCYAGSDGKTCQPCHRDADHARRAREYHSERGKRKARARNNAIAMKHPDRYADGLATWAERHGA